MNKPEWIIVHHEAPPQIVDSARFNSVNEFHRSRGFPLSKLGFYVGYHVFIEKTGALYRARNDDEIGAHTVGENANSLGICMAGNFNLELPTDAQRAVLKSQIKDWILKFDIPLDHIVPHRHFAQKDCYGKNLSDDWAQKLVEGTPDEKLSFLQSWLALLKKKLSDILKVAK